MKKDFEAIHLKMFHFSLGRIDEAQETNNHCTRNAKVEKRERIISHFNPHWQNVTTREKRSLAGKQSESHAENWKSFPS